MITFIEHRTVESYDLKIKGEPRVLATVLLCRWKDGWWLYRLHVPEADRRKGYASRLVLALIDTINEPIYLSPHPFDDEPMDIDRLRQWYERLGWVPHDDDQLVVGLYPEDRIMVRRPD